jgi:phosphoribosylformylglycinamidine synthase PurS subunit
MEVLPFTLSLSTKEREPVAELMENLMLAKVYVTPKKAILDPQGKAITHSLQALHYNEVSDVRMGKYLELRLTGVSRAQAEQRVEDMCRRLLANLVIEDFRFEIIEE